jgi:hypothetical protein
VERWVARATCMSRPAKPARQTRYARSPHEACVERLPAGRERQRFRACLVCRASFAGRGTAVARVTIRLMLGVLSGPRRSLGSAYRILQSCQMPIEHRRT